MFNEDEFEFNGIYDIDAEKISTILAWYKSAIVESNKSHELGDEVLEKFYAGRARMAHDVLCLLFNTSDQEE